MKTAVDWMLSRQSAGRLIEEKGSILGNSEQEHMKESEENECYEYVVLNFSTLTGKLSFKSPTQ